MVDSIRETEDSYFKRLHSRHTSGKLHKGHGITAATSSIPSRYQTVVTDNSDRKGFNAKSRRFNYEAGVDENPGPGTYMGRSSIETKSTSFSKKGTGGFASKTKRSVQNHSTVAPPSNTYSLPSMLTTRKDYNKGYTCHFHKPIAHPVEKTNGVPAPNEYDVLKHKRKFGRSNNVTADAAFKSTSIRDVLNIKDAAKKPAPWQYNVNDKLQRDAVKVPFSSFKSTSVRQMAADPPNYPGPGAYKPEIPVEAPELVKLPRKHYLCISAPAMPLPPPIPNPGPGSYELVNYEGPQRHYMSSSMFVSTTSRWTGGEQKYSSDLPGPAHYHPGTNPAKQNFIYNAAGRWI